MALPDFPTVTDEALRAIVAQHGLGVTVFAPMPQIGTFNTIFALGETFVLRVPRQDSRFTDAARNEAIGVPLARAAGVRTPALVVFDETESILPVPFGIFERVAGTSLEQAAGDFATASAVWTELGRDLARLHAGVTETPELETWPGKTDPRPLPDIIAAEGYFAGLEATWLNEWLDRLAPHIAPAARVFIHGDSQAANVMADAGEYRAVIDWGSCQWGDVADDFAGVPLRAVPAMLEGYAEAGGTIDETMEARILWRHLQIALHQWRGTPKPTWSWAERPLGMPLEILRFFLEEPGPRWRQWAPPGRIGG